jgi:hypothetical protein
MFNWFFPSHFKFRKPKVSMVGSFQILGLLEHLKKLEPNQFIGIQPSPPPTTSHSYDILNMMVEWTYCPLVRYLI